MITKEVATKLRHGDELHCGECSIRVGPRGGETLIQERWRVNGVCKTWKTRPEDFRLPIKWGLKTCSYLEPHNAHLFHTPDDCVPKRVGPGVEKADESPA